MIEVEHVARIDARFDFAQPLIFLRLESGGHAIVLIAAQKVV